MESWVFFEIGRLGLVMSNWRRLGSYDKGWLAWQGALTEPKSHPIDWFWLGFMKLFCLSRFYMILYIIYNTLFQSNGLYLPYIWYYTCKDTLDIVKTHSSYAPKSKSGNSPAWPRWIQEQWVVADGNDGHLFHTFVRAMNYYGISSLLIGCSINETWWISWLSESLKHRVLVFHRGMLVWRFGR